VDDEPIGTRVDEPRRYLRRVTFDRDPVNTDDFLCFCEQIGAEPVLQLPLVNKPGSWSPDYCAAWLEYCNGAPTTQWGKLRAERGHPEPYGVRYVETSNEPYYGDEWRDASAAYVAAQQEVIPRLRGVDPHVLCIVNTNYHNEDVFPPLKDLVDGVGMRHYYGEQLGKSDEQQLPWLLGASVAIRKDKRAPEGKDELACDLYADWPWLRATFGDRDVFLAQTEYDYWLRYQPDKLATLGCAIYKAGMLCSMMKHNVRIAETFYLPRPGTTTMAAYELITGEFTPPEYGDCRFVPAQVTCGETPFDVSYGARPEYNSYVLPVLTAAGSLAGDGRSMSVLLIHRGTEAPLDARVSVAGFAARAYTGIVLTGPNVNVADAAPAPLPVREAEGGFSVELPPLSIAVVRAPR
jgi:alpha-L-arabinofuranosidase